MAISYLINDLILYGIILLRVGKRIEKREGGREEKSKRRKKRRKKPV
jgi:hypothetical protein